MADVLTPDQRQLNMSRIRGRDTKPEMLIRRGLHARGFRYRVNVQAEREAEERARQLAIANEAAEHDLALKTHRATQAEMAIHHPTQPQVATVSGRSELIAATMLKALRAWNGKAAECKACHLLSAPGSRFCPYCAVDGRGLIETTVSPDLPATIHKRMYCSAKPGMSAKAAPNLVVRPDI